jgi:hypothetical protein
MDTQNAPDILEGYVRPHDLAKELRVSVRTLGRWQVRRIGPPRIVIGKQIFYRRDAVRAWLESREQKRRT